MKEFIELLEGFLERIAKLLEHVGIETLWRYLAAAAALGVSVYWLSSAFRNLRGVEGG